MKHNVFFVYLVFLAMLIAGLTVGTADGLAGPDGAAPGVHTVKAVSPQYVIVDDFAGVSLENREWYYTRIGTDRGEMGDENGSYNVDIGGGSASVTVQSGWGGVWSSLKYNAITDDVLDPTRLLGPYVKSQYQSHVTGVEMDILSGSGTLKLELKKKNGSIITQKRFTLNGGKETLTLDFTPTENISKLNWLVEGAGHVTVDEVRFVIQSPDLSVREAVFLYTYGHLCQCYDADSGLVRDRARWPVQDFAAVQAIGTFALATATAWDLGFVSQSTAQTIIANTRDTLLGLPRHAKGLLPHFLKNGAIVTNTEWSSVDTVIAVTAQILACQAVGLDASGLETLLKGIDWNDLTGNGAHSISHGYTYAGDLLAGAWDTFGSEALLAATVYSAVTGKTDVKLDAHDTTPTWDGSGFNDEMAALFYPMNVADVWGNDWSQYRQAAFTKQSGYFSGHNYESIGLFGLSAGEVPEPWTVAESKVYSAWGVGGHNGEANDGTTLVGYPIIAPHYAAMIAAEHPEAFETVFTYLIETGGIFTPLNNVETFGIDGGSELHWNSLKGAWNLSLQVLGVGRALSGDDYIAYRALSQNSFLNQGYGKICTVVSPEIALSETELIFGSNGGQSTSAREVTVSNSAGGSLNWTAGSDQSWLNVSPASGAGAGIITVSVNASGLSAGTYTGTVSIACADASNSPQTIAVTLEVHAPGSGSAPFGQFSTPGDGAMVSSSIAVTGWALDDIECTGVTIYREANGGLAYIGDALFVEGARPDVAQLYPDYPLNNRAGWGYMMLTNFLPNGGNGTFTFHAVATDAEGNQTTLGVKTITVDNANAVKPFGAIDTPIPGGSASGGVFRNNGWVLTPMPNTVPTDGSTINVYVDGVYLGHPGYNVYRPDIAALFPGYANSQGAAAYFDLDTTAYADGVHTIEWSATDDAGNTDGIGSRYFAVQNIGIRGKGSGVRRSLGISDKRSVVRRDQGVRIKKGFNRHTESEEIRPDADGIIRVEIEELQRLELHLPPDHSLPQTAGGAAPPDPLSLKNAAPIAYQGYSKVRSQLRPLPIGSTLDPTRGVFSWSPGPGFVGTYQLVFVREKTADGSLTQTKVNVHILPKRR